MGDNAPMNTTTKAQDRALLSLIHGDDAPRSTSFVASGAMLVTHVSGARTVIERNGKTTTTDQAAA